MVEEFVRRGYEVHLFCPTFPDLPAVADRFGVRVQQDFVGVEAVPFKAAGRRWSFDAIGVVHGLA